jgi:hypothetical protein
MQRKGLQHVHNETSNNGHSSVAINMEQRCVCKGSGNFLPNGLKAVVHGTASSTQENKLLLRFAEFNDYLKDLCEEHHNNVLCATDGDGIFCGYWCWLCSCHIVA